MISAVLTSPKTFRVKAQSLPLPDVRSITVKLEGCGICASSIPVWEGREWFRYPQAPGAPGHEGWGIVENVGEGITKVKPGDRVAFLSGNSFAEYDLAKEGSYIVLPESLKDTPFPGEPLGCAMNIFERSQISAGDTIAIIGTGFLGALLCQLAKNEGARVIAITKRKFSLGMARLSGADELISFTDVYETAGKLNEITKGAGCTRIIEATGKQEALDLATEIAGEYARIIIAGYHQDGLRTVNMQKWNWKGLDIINAHERDPARYLEGMRKAVDAVLLQKINPEPLYTDILPLAHLNNGFHLAAERPEGFMKALVHF